MSSDKIVTLFSKSPQLTRGHIACLCSTCFFGTNYSLLLNLLGISFMIFLEESFSQFQVSTHAHFISMSLLLSTCLMQLKSLRFKLLIDLLRSDVRNFHLPVPCLKFCFSSIHCLLCRSLSPRTAISASHSRILWRFSLNECTTL